MLWIAFISIAFCLPELNPVSTKTLNYAPVAVGIVLTYSLGFWALSARRWFTGPAEQIEGAPAIYVMFVSCVNTDDKWSVRTEKDERLGTAESSGTSEKANFLEM